MEVAEVYGMIRFILFSVGAALLSGASPVLMRAGARRSDPSLTAAVFASALLPCSLVPLAFSGRLTALFSVSGSSLFLLLLCGALSALCYLCLFTALSGTATARVMPLMNLEAVLLCAAGYFLFGEQLWITKLCCMLLVLLGTVLMESRSKAGSWLWLLYALLALLARAGRSLLMQAYVPNIDSALALPFTSAFAAVLLWLFTLLRGKQKKAASLGVRGWLCVPLAALALAGASVLTLLGSALGAWSWLAPISCLGFLSMLLFARLFLGEKLPGSALFGTILVLAGTIGMMMGW